MSGILDLITKLFDGITIETPVFDGSQTPDELIEGTLLATLKACEERERRDIAGALFDFLAFLTIQKKTLAVGASEPCAGSLCDLLSEWAAIRGLSIENARIKHWTQCLPSNPEGLAQIVNPNPPASANDLYVGGSSGENAVEKEG
jgi:hypothetical protein